MRRRRKNWNRKARAGKNSFPPTPFPRTRTSSVWDFAFCPPERSVSAVPPTAGAISRSFVQKRFKIKKAIPPLNSKAKAGKKGRGFFLGGEGNFCPPCLPPAGACPAHRCGNGLIRLFFKPRLFFVPISLARRLNLLKILLLYLNFAENYFYL